MIGFIETYKAYCDQFKTEPSKSFMTFAETLFRSGSLGLFLVSFFLFLFLFLSLFLF